MTAQQFPGLDAKAIADTRNAVHAYAQILGDWRRSTQPRRKHWWQITLYPSVRGLTTGLVHSGVDYELELDLTTDRLLGQVAGGQALSEPLGGRPVNELAEIIQGFLLENGIDRKLIPAANNRESHVRATPGYSAEIAATLGHALRSINAAMNEFKAGIPEETSPIQIWPHHFDLAMLWLPGEKIPGQDPENEENSDKQMNFGFTFGDEGIPEPYFYVTASPLPDAFSSLVLPEGTTWNTEGFNGAVLAYRTLVENESPGDYLVSLWSDLLSTGRQHMLTNAGRGLV
jgi:hypothetical protein